MADDFYNNLTVLLLADDTSPIEPSLVDRSVFFEYAFVLNLVRVILPAEDHLKKDESLGTLWIDIQPADGLYTIELATELPYYLPNFEMRPEAAFVVHGSELVVSSRMSRCFFRARNKPNDELQYYLCHQLAIPSPSL